MAVIHDPILGTERKKDLAIGETVVNGSNTAIVYINSNTQLAGNLNFVFDEANGRVGIGTTAPAAMVDIDDGGVTATIPLRLDVKDGSVSALEIYRSGTKRFNIIEAATYTQIGDASSGQHIVLIPTGVGKVGINTTGPAYKLDITGDLRTTSDTHLAVTSGRVGVGTATPTAYLHLKAGTATSSTTPFKFTSGTLVTTTEEGAMEFLTDDLYFTQTTNTSRHNVAWQDNPLPQQIFA